MDIIQPYITGIIQALIGLLVSIIIGALLILRQRFDAWLASRTSANQRELLHKLSAEAFAYAEAIFKDTNGQEKFTAAYGYLSRRAREYKIGISEAEIRAIIEKSVLEFNATKKEVPNESI